MQGVDRIAIFGADGMLGRYVSSVLKTYNPTLYTRKDFDILSGDFKNLPDYDLVINCAGIIKQRNADNVEMYKVNTLFPVVLNRKYRLIQISTDCVFKSRGRRYEHEEPDATDHYGLSKARGEVGMVIRTSIIGQGNPLSLLDWVLSKQSCDGYKNHWWNGVTCLQLAKYIRWIIDFNQYKEGVYNYHSETVNKYDLCQMIAKAYNHKIDINPVWVDHIDRTLIGREAPISLAEQLYEMANYNL